MTITNTPTPETRDDKLAAALIAPETTPSGLRRYSAASMILLQHLRNPLADFNPQSVNAISNNLYAFAEFVWVHLAPLETVRKMVLSVDKEAITEAVLALAEQYSPAGLAALIPEILRDAEQVTAAMARAIPEGKPSKNSVGLS